MQPHGSDRLTVAPDGTILLACRRSKGWVVRTAATNTTPEHPGTAVLWDGEFFEVVRLGTMKTHPCGSVLGYVVRPFCGVLLRGK